MGRISRIALTFVILLTSTSVNGNYVKKEKSRLVGFFNGLITDLDPANIQTNMQWHILPNLGVNLTSYDFESRLIPSAAMSWEVSSDFKQFKFKLNESYRDSNGRRLTSEDWKSTFLHLIHSDGPSHSFIAELLKPAGIIAKSAYTLELHLERPYSTFLHRLTSPEFILLSRDSINNGSVDFSVSSGAYFISKFNYAKNEINLSVNKFFPSFTSEQPQEVTLVSSGKGGTKELVKRMAGNEIHFALASLFPTDDEMFLISQKLKLLNVKSVNPSNAVFLIFGPNSILPKRSKLALTKLLIDEARTDLKSISTTPAAQFFPPQLQGSLNLSEERKLYTDLESSASNSDLPKRIILYSSNFTTAHHLDKWVADKLRKHGIDVELHSADLSEFRSQRLKIKHDIFLISSGVNSKDPAGSLLDLLDSKGGWIEDNDKSLLQSLKLASLEDKKMNEMALHTLSRDLVLKAKVIPLLHYSTSILSTKDLEVSPPTMFDDEVRIHTIRWK